MIISWMLDFLFPENHKAKKIDDALTSKKHMANFSTFRLWQACVADVKRIHLVRVWDKRRCLAVYGSFIGTLWWFPG